jgi:hypothetical protein
LLSRGDPIKVSIWDGDKQRILSEPGEGVETAGASDKAIEAAPGGPRREVPIGAGVRAAADKLLRKLAAESLAERNDGDGVPDNPDEAVDNAGTAVRGAGVVEVAAALCTKDAKGFFKFTKF